MQIIAKTFEGLENTVANEIKELGGENINIVKRAVEYEGALSLVYKSNLHLRSAIKVLINIAQFSANDEYELYEKAKKIPWFDFIGLNQTFAIDSNVNSEFFKHSKYVAYKVKDAIADKFTEIRGRRPNVNVYNPDVRINIRIFQNNVDISLDSSGDPLHIRGYKIDNLYAPLNEVLAAGILLNTDFNQKDSFYDPMCGSGTLLTEAMMINTNYAPNIHRESFGFMTWHDFDNKLWKSILNNAKESITKPSIHFFGSDIDRKAVFATKKNLTILNFGNDIDVKQADFFKIKNCSDFKFIIMNPPYDVRLQTEDIIGFYKNIGDKLKKDCTGIEAWVFSANLEALKLLGLKPDSKTKLMNGKLPAELRKYSLY
ncbi:MAG: THUMP domain-containing protein [Saprospiraceae bacterium]